MGFLSDIGSSVGGSLESGLKRTIFRTNTRRPFRASDKNLGEGQSFFGKTVNSFYSAAGSFESAQNKWHARNIQAGLSTQILIQSTDVRGQRHVIGAIQTMTPTEARPMQRLSEIGNDTVVQTIPNGVFTVDIAVNRLVFDYKRLPAAFARGFRHIHAQRLPFDIIVLDMNQYQEFLIPETSQVMVDGFKQVSSSLPFIGDKLRDGIEKGKEILTYDDRDVVDIGDDDFQERNPAKGDLSPGTEGIPALEYVETRFVNCWLVNYSYTYDQSNYLIAENATIWAETVQDGDTTRPRSPYESDVVEGNYNDRIAEMRGNSTRLDKGLAG